jgi:hypothetical protein
MRNAKEGKSSIINKFKSITIFSKSSLFDFDSVSAKNDGIINL